MPPSSLLPVLLALGPVALAAGLLALRRPRPAGGSLALRPAARALGVAVGAQAVHFGEEWWTRFPERLGPLLGLPAMPWSFFLAFNVVWLSLWILAIPGLGAARRDALFAAWFLAITGMANGIAHPFLSLRASGYFPGLITSPLVALAGLVLAARLAEATRRRPEASRPTEAASRERRTDR